VGFLAIVAIMPFSTELLANFIGFRIAPVVCWLNILRLGARCSPPGIAPASSSPGPLRDRRRPLPGQHHLKHRLHRDV